MMKRMICMLLALVLMVAALTACSLIGNEKKGEPQSSPTTAADKVEGKMVHGIISKIDSYLVLLTEDGEYHVMDLGDGVTLDDFAEGDSVDVTYTGELGVEGTTPVVIAIEKTK